MRTPLVSSLVIGVSLLLINGCGEANKLGRQPVSGAITLDGEALDKGTILFAPNQPSGVSSGTEILDGSYSIPAKQGLTPGSYTVRIYAADEDGADVEPVIPGPGIKVKREKVPLVYNMRSELELIVTDSEAAVFDLDMKSK